MGNSLAVQGLGLSSFTTEVQVQSLVRELRSYKPHVVRSNKQRNKSNTIISEILTTDYQKRGNDSNVFFLMEAIIQSEVSQKEKHQYSILMHIYGI